MKINKKDIFKSTNRDILEKAKLKEAEIQSGRKSKPNIVSHDFSKGVEITDHFIARAQERFGLKDLHDLSKTRAYVNGWAQDLLNNYDELVRCNDKDQLAIRCREIVIIYNKAQNCCITCYPITYNTNTKQYDTLQTTIEKKKLNLDDFTMQRVDETFKNIYYQELRQYGKFLAGYHKQISNLYESLSNTRKNDLVDIKLDSINQLNSIVKDIESKLQNVKNVIIGKEQ